MAWNWQAEIIRVTSPMRDNLTHCDTDGLQFKFDEKTIVTIDSLIIFKLALEVIAVALAKKASNRLHDPTANTMQVSTAN